MRRLRRFLSSGKLPNSGETSFLSVEETHHLRHILRLDVGDRCLVIDGQGAQAEATIIEFSSDGTTQVEIVRKQGISGEPAWQPTRIYQAIPKHQKLDYLIEKAQELGVEEICPMITERTIVRLDDEVQRQKKLDRWERVAKEAAKQSGQPNSIKIRKPVFFEEAMDCLLPQEEVLFLHPDKQALPFKEWLDDFTGRQTYSKLTRLNIFLGPEGGFAPSETALIAQRCGEKKAGCSIVSLGSSIWKADTAFLGIVAAIKLMTTD